MNEADEFKLEKFLGLEPLLQSSFRPTEESEEQINKSLSDEFLSPSNKLTWDLLDLMQHVPEFETERVYSDLMYIPQSIGRTSIRFKRSGIDGKISTYKEELKISEIDHANGHNSLAINRKHASKNDYLRGKTSFLPFQPGGLLEKSKDASKREAAFLHRNNIGLFDIPQGFTRGLDITSENDDNLQNLGATTDESGEYVDIVGETLLDHDNTVASLNSTEAEHPIPFSSEEVEGLVPLDYLAMKKNTDIETMHKKNWAHIVHLDHKLENFSELVPHMAREWPFELDKFQKEAIYYLEQGDSVFIAAHTSAGKTVVAEYAIAMAARNMTKAIYTSPIKALSNQKFRDFKEHFKDVDVGLITGDVQINPEANCLIMTTEILRSMLYRGADLIRDVEFVIFDEVHYVNDIDRGVVWEEVIIMLPDHIKYVLLSATVPNTFEFANWVGRTKQKDVYVISTPKRPVPLEIFIWAKSRLFKVVDANRKWLESEFKAHKLFLESGKKKEPPSVTMGYGSRGGRGGTARGGNRGGGTPRRGNLSGNRGALVRDGPNKNTWNSLVQYLKQHKLLPAVVFVFSKKRCEEYADTLSNIDFCNAKEKSEIHMFIDKAVARLKKEDRELPQILKIRELLSRGIAVHHGGLLPIVKECIEILFAKSFVKVLFATETFAMGLNLPTRTVVFNTIRKHDGRNFRNLLPGEFTQMSGRAGRRGLDPTGTVIIMSYNEPLSPTDVKTVCLGAATKLLSQFRLTYSMILNLLRIEALRVEEMIKHSFSENSTQTLLPEHQLTVQKLTEELKTLKIDECSKCDTGILHEVFEFMTDYEGIYHEIVEIIESLSLLKNTVMRTGRLLCYRQKSGMIMVGFLVRSNLADKSLLVLTFDLGAEFENDSIAFGLPWLPDAAYLRKFMKRMVYSGSLRIESVPYSRICFLGNYVLKSNIKSILQNDSDAISDAEARISRILKAQNQWEEFEFQLVTQLSLHELLESKRILFKKLLASPCLACESFKKHYAQMSEQHKIKDQISSLQSLISDENLELLPDYEQRLDVLRVLGFIDSNQNVTLKGRVACEINSGWELIISELVFENFLGDFEPEEIVALLSCFVYEGRTNEEEENCITPRLDRGKQKILSVADKLLKVYSEKQVLLTSEEEDFLERKRFALVNVVYEWARGLSFNEIMQISVEAEGTIVRVITRLDEICREVKNAALIVGDSTLHAKMSEAQEKIKRDIVFCASLYL